LVIREQLLSRWAEVDFRLGAGSDFAGFWGLKPGESGEKIMRQ